MLSSTEIVEEFLRLKGYKGLNRTQDLTVKRNLLSSQDNFVVIAPTASGKTGVAELAILKELKNSNRVAYLAPLKSLVQEKADKFSEFLEEEYTIFPGGEGNFNTSDLVISTFEGFYKNALLSPFTIESFSLIVIDEFHILYDKLRGYNLEKVLTILKMLDKRIICLSATFENKEKIGDWLEAQLIVVPNEYRSVPLEHNILDYREEETKTIIKKIYSLIYPDKIPSIIFCTVKRYTKSRAEKTCDLINKKVNQRSEIIKEFERLLNRDEFTRLELSLLDCLEKGVAFHHAGLHTKIRNLIEKYFNERKINFLFSTTTLAYGINSPAKSVILYDSSFWNPSLRRREPIDAYLYQQMAGRAGRPEFGDIGYSYIIATNGDEYTRLAPHLIQGELEEASSHINYDDYFRKTFLELIYSERSTDDEIIEFFENTYYNYLSNIKEGILPFNLSDVLASHANYLRENRFITYQGAPGYRLTGLGKVVMEFLMDTFVNYELESFIRLDRYLDSEETVRTDFNLIYELFKMFDEICLQRIPYRSSGEIENYFSREYELSKKQISDAEYSAYVTWYGWIKNLDIIAIENNYQVYSTQIQNKMREVNKLLRVYKKLAESKRFEIPEELEKLIDRVYHGVKEGELIFKREYGIGRKTASAINNYCENVLVNPPWNLRGTSIEKLVKLCF